MRTHDRDSQWIVLNSILYIQNPLQPTLFDRRDYFSVIWIVYMSGLKQFVRDDEIVIHITKFLQVCSYLL